MIGLSDTSPEAERIVFEAYRRMSPAQKWRQLGQLYADGRYLHAAGVRRRNIHATQKDILADWLRDNLGMQSLPPIGEVHEVLPEQSLRDLRDVVRVLDQLGVRHALGGSMASSFYSISRHTNDADLSVEPFSGKEELFAATLGENFYVSVQAVKDAMQRRGTFNVVNILTGFKADFFIQSDEPFGQQLLRRRVRLDPADTDSTPIFLQSPEDVILCKMRWYRLGNEVSEQQWKDVLGVLRMQADRLDYAYLDNWAADLGVGDLLDRARQQSQLP